MAYMQNSPFRKGCAKSEGGSGCIVQRNGQWVILNNKKAGDQIWRKCKSKKHCEDMLKAYQTNK